MVAYNKTVIICPEKKGKDMKIEFAEIDLIREHKLERKHWLRIGEITIKALLPYTHIQEMLSA